MPPLLEDQAVAYRLKLQPKLFQEQFTTAQLHKSILLSNLSTAQNAAEKANVDEDAKPAAKDATHTAAAEKANVERAAAAASTQDEVKIAEKADV